MDFAKIEKAIFQSPKWQEATAAINAAVKECQRPLTQEEVYKLNKLRVLATILSDSEVFRLYADELYADTNSAR